MQWRSYIPTKMENQNSSDEITQTPCAAFSRKSDYQQQLRNITQSQFRNTKHLMTATYHYILY